MVFQLEKHAWSVVQQQLGFQATRSRGFDRPGLKVERSCCFQQPPSPLHDHLTPGRPPCHNDAPLSFLSRAYKATRQNAPGTSFPEAFGDWCHRLDKGGVQSAADKVAKAAA